MSAVELARLLVDRDDHWSVTLLIMELPTELLVLTDCMQSLFAPIFGRIHTINLLDLIFQS